jgi:hypothetical protein
MQVQLLIYFMLKYAMEILLSESSVITNHYFSWNTSEVAIFLAILGLTVLPVNAVVGTYISNMFEDRFVIFFIHAEALALLRPFPFSPSVFIGYYHKVRDHGIVFSLPLCR